MTKRLLMATGCLPQLLALACLSAGCVQWDEPIYSATRTVVKRFKVGEPPTIIVRLERNSSHVTAVLGRPGEVTSTVSLCGLSTESQAVADKYVESAQGPSMQQEGNTIRVTDPEGNRAGCDVTLTVPPDSTLDITALGAEIRVGADGRGTTTPIPIRCLRVTTDRILHVDIASPTTGEPTLELEAAQIELAIDGRREEITKQPDQRTASGRYRYTRP